MLKLERSLGEFVRNVSVKPPKLRLVKVLKGSIPKVRVKIRNLKIAQEIERIKDDRVRKLVEALCSISEFQPISKALIAAVEKWLNGYVTIKGYSKRAYYKKTGAD